VVERRGEVGVAAEGEEAPTMEAEEGAAWGDGPGGWVTSRLVRRARATVGTDGVCR
jgi:hypothetical protein